MYNILYLFCILINLLMRKRIVYLLIEYTYVIFLFVNLI